MLKITATGNLTNDVELKMSETTGKPYAILRIASDRRYRDQEGNRLTDFISIKVRGPLAEFCAAYAWKGNELTIRTFWVDFISGETITVKFTDNEKAQLTVQRNYQKQAAVSARMLPYTITPNP